MSPRVIILGGLALVSLATAYPVAAACLAGAAVVLSAARSFRAPRLRVGALITYAKLAAALAVLGVATLVAVVAFQVTGALLPALTVLAMIALVAAVPALLWWDYAGQFRAAERTTTWKARRGQRVAASYTREQERREAMERAWRARRAGGGGLLPLAGSFRGLASGLRQRIGARIAVREFGDRFPVLPRRGSPGPTPNPVQEPVPDSPPGRRGTACACGARYRPGGAYELPS